MSQHRTPTGLSLGTATLLLASLASPLAAQNFGDGLERSRALSTAVSTEQGFDILSCPFSIFKEAYLGAFEAADRLAVMALEDEAIAACAKRQEQVNLVLTQERKLRELLSASAEDADATSDDIPARAHEERTVARQDPTPTVEQSASTGGNTLAGGVIAAVSGATDENTDSTPVIVAQSETSTVSNTGCTAHYMVEMSGHQRSGDGKFHWASLRSGEGETYVVKAGDALPGGWKISSVSKQVVLAADATGEIVQIPVAPTQGSDVIDGNFYYTITPAKDLQLEAEGNEQ